MQADTSHLERSRLYSEELCIDLKSNRDEELFKWFLASILFGARISETIAKNTYKSFEKYGLLTPQGIMKAGRDFLVYPVMREGEYIRYDELTSAKLLKICETLTKDYNGSLKELHRQAKDSADLENKITSFYGIGPVTANIFLRELRPFWKKSDPEPLPVVKKIARIHNINLGRYQRKTIAFARVEAGLIRLRKEKEILKKHKDNKNKHS